MADGLVSPAQATVVVQVLDDLPDHLGLPYCSPVRDQDGRPVRTFGLLSCVASASTCSMVVAPEIAEAEEAKRRKNEEQRAREEDEASALKLIGGRPGRHHDRAHNASSTAIDC